MATPVAYEPVELHDLTRVEQELARWRRTEEGIAGFRATTLNLVIHAADDAHANTAIDALSEIGAARPLRAIIATSADDSPRAILSSSCPGARRRSRARSGRCSGPTCRCFCGGRGRPQPAGARCARSPSTPRA